MKMNDFYTKKGSSRQIHGDETNTETTLENEKRIEENGKGDYIMKEEFGKS